MARRTCGDPKRPSRGSRGRGDRRPNWGWCHGPAAAHPLGRSNPRLCWNRSPNPRVCGDGKWGDEREEKRARFAAAHASSENSLEQRLTGVPDGDHAALQATGDEPGGECR